MVTASPSWPALPLTLMRSCKNFSNEEGSRTRSSTGMKQSITNLTVCFLEDFLDLGYSTREERGGRRKRKPHNRGAEEDTRKGGGRGETARCVAKRIQQPFHCKNQLVIYKLCLGCLRCLAGRVVCVAHESRGTTTQYITYPNAALRVCDNRREGDSATVSRV